MLQTTVQAGAEEVDPPAFGYVILVQAVVYPCLLYLYLCTEYVYTYPFFAGLNSNQFTQT